MRVDLIPHLCLIDKHDLTEKTVIAIDLLRATSTIITALENGAKGIIPVETLLEAEQINQKIKNSLLAGEREGVKIKGFALGNSPIEFTPNRVRNKTVILCTTNGTKTLLKCQGADKVFIGSFLNRKACLDYVAKLQKDILLLCAGRKNGPAQEDSICAGAYVKYLRNNFYKMHFSNLAMEAYYLYQTLGNSLHDMVYKSPSGQNLISMGLKVDIDFCLRKDVFNTIALFKDGVIQKAKN